MSPFVDAPQTKNEPASSQKSARGAISRRTRNGRKNGDGAGGTTGGPEAEATDWAASPDPCALSGKDPAGAEGCCSDGAASALAEEETSGSARRLTAATSTGTSPCGKGCGAQSGSGSRRPQLSAGVRGLGEGTGEGSAAGSATAAAAPRAESPTSTGRSRSSSKTGRAAAPAIPAMVHATPRHPRVCEGGARSGRRGKRAGRGGYEPARCTRGAGRG